MVMTRIGWAKSEVFLTGRMLGFESRNQNRSRELLLRNLFHVIGIGNCREKVNLNSQTCQL